MSTIRTFQRIVTKGRKDSSSPLVETPIEAMLGWMYRTTKFGIYFSVPCVETAISNHFKVFFRDVSDETFDKINGRDSFFHIFFVFMPVIMKSDQFTIIFINAGSGYGRTPEITANIFDYIFGITFLRFRINIKTIQMVRIVFCFCFFKRRT